MATATQNRPNRYDSRCADCGGQVPAGDGDLSREADRWVTRHVVACPEVVPLTGAALAASQGMPEPGYYAVEWNGDLKFYRVAEGKDHNAGRIFLNRFRTDYLDRPQARERREAVALILADPLAASMRFAKESIRCYRCGRRLTDKDSRARGLGPDCAAM